MKVERRMGDPDSYIPVVYKVQIKKAITQFIGVYSMSLNTGMQFNIICYYLYGICTLSARLSTIFI